MSNHEFEVEMLDQIITAVKAGDRAKTTRLVDRLLRESTDPAATEARIQQAIRDAR
ncbi:hypothetical protein ACIRRH_41135 [Kitasatospora sp. NPDC101235]|uniref:hypothetical protein n=1 Tax=Kitasatospora sp. NPDC101235 TaxID=3364101 RepID=UPI00380F03C2